MMHVVSVLHMVSCPVYACVHACVCVCVSNSIFTAIFFPHQGCKTIGRFNVINHSVVVDRSQIFMISQE